MTTARVLIVDDDIALLQALPEALRLRMETVAVDTCSTAPEGLERIAAIDYDAIISDIKMPGMDGLALLARVRTLRPDTPTLLITGHGEHELAVQALRGGAYDFIQKPIDREYFVASLGRALQLRQLSRRVKELDELRTKFFANVSHELRTPLALILGLTEKLVEEGELPERQRHDLEVIDRNAQTLLKHVNDLLDIAKLDAGQMEVAYADVNLAHVLRLAAAHFEAFARERRITFSIQAPPAVPVQADAEKLQRVFLNLLSNAFKFVPDGGAVRCALRAEGDSARATVQDNGPGVPPELREAIFERFRQGEAGRGRRFGGTGLGLAIAKEFITLHHGAITVDDAPEGGALFGVTIPRAAPIGARVEAALHADGRSEFGRRALATPPHDRQNGRSSPGSAGLPAEAAPDRPLILIIEDNPEMNRFISETLAREYRVAAAYDGQEGLEKALAVRPDLIVADVIMPGLGGDELVREVRKRPELETIPIVVLTAKVDDDLRVRLLREGAEDYLTKPFSAQELRARVGNLVAMKRARETLEHELVRRSSNLAVLAAEAAARQGQLRTALAALHDADERARVLLESVKDYAIFMLDPQGHVGTWNTGAERITGYAAEEVIGKPFSQFYPAEETRRGTPEHDLGRARAEGRFEVEAWRVRKDGSRFWANAILTALPAGEGHFRGFSVVTRDVTERRSAEEQMRASLNEKEVLLRELHHRVKNNLQVICSLLNLQSKAIPDGRTRDVFMAMQNRVKSMALIHDQLYRAGDLARIDFTEYVRRLAVTLFRSYAVDPDAITLTVEIDQISLGLDMAVPCGLIINELIANSLKHAFPPGRRGQIGIGLRTGGAATCELTVSDDGVGLPLDCDLSAASSFGLQLVATLVDQLGGKLEVERHGGTRFTIRFPGPPERAERGQR